MSVTVVIALLNTYLPEMQRGRSFVQELQYTAVLASMVGVAIIVTNVALDSWDRTRSRRVSAGYNNPEQGAP